MGSQPQTPVSPESPLPSTPGREEEREGEEEEEVEEGRMAEGPLVPALLSKLQRLLDQVQLEHYPVLYTVSLINSALFTISVIRSEPSADLCAVSTGGIHTPTH